MQKRNIGSGSDQYLVQALEYMRDHLHENLTLSQVAKETGISVGHLNAVFQKHMRRAPMNCYKNMKMEKASSLLLSTDLRICQISRLLAYDNQYYFSRAFKNVYGVSPKAYRMGGGLMIHEAG